MSVDWVRRVEPAQIRKPGESAVRSRETGAIRDRDGGEICIRNEIPADPLARGLIWSSLWNACRDAELAVTDYLTTVRGHAPSESNSALQQSVSANAVHTVANYVPDAQRSVARRERLDATWSSLWDAAPGVGSAVDVGAGGVTNNHLDATIAGFRTGERRDLLADYDDAYFAAIRGVWEQRSIEIARRIVLGLFPAAETPALVDGWLAAHGDAPAALRRLVVERRDQLARALRVREWNSGQL